jgi:hypothetical protein
MSLVQIMEFFSHVKIEFVVRLGWTADFQRERKRIEYQFAFRFRFRSTVRIGLI